MRQTVPASQMLAEVMTLLVQTENLITPDRVSSMHNPLLVL